MNKLRARPTGTQSTKPSDDRLSYYHLCQHPARGSPQSNYVSCVYWWCFSLSLFLSLSFSILFSLATVVGCNYIIYCYLPIGVYYIQQLPITIYTSRRRANDVQIDMVLFLYLVLQISFRPKRAALKLLLLYNDDSPVYLPCRLYLNRLRCIKQKKTHFSNIIIKYFKKYMISVFF